MTVAEGGTQGRVLVSGATGMIGGLLVDALVERGVVLAAMVRPGSDPGRLIGRASVEIVEGDFDDPGSLERALLNVQRAFLVTNSTERTEGQQKAFVQAAWMAGVQHLVKLSQLHAAADSPVRFLRYHAAVRRRSSDQASLTHTCARTSFCRPICRLRR